MLADLISTLVTPQRNRPLSVAVAIVALFVSAALVIFLARPSLYGQLGLNGVILLSLAISLPVVLLCYGIWYTPLSALWRLQKLVTGQPFLPPNMESALEREDPLEWPCLLTGAWTANVVLYSIAAIAYYKPIRVGATFLLTGGILAGIWALVFAVSTVAYFVVERKWKTKIAELIEAQVALAQAQADLAKAQAGGAA